MFKLIAKAKKNQKGFTLVELMVVVIIIGILVAIAIPTYNNVQANAKAKANEANIRTLKGVAAQYMAESDIVTFTWNGTAGSAGTTQTWVPYLAEWPKDPVNSTPAAPKTYTVVVTSGAIVVNVDQANVANPTP